MLGTTAIVEEMTENYSQEFIGFSENENWGTYDETPCGGEGDGGPPIPG